MKRMMKYVLGAVMAVILFGAAAGAVAWLTGTTEGARWLLESISRHSGVRISARRVEGRLLDHLRLGDVRITSKQQETEIDSLDLRCRALLLLMGRVSVQELTLQGVRVRDSAPVSKDPPLLVWPRVSGIAEIFAGNIARLRVKGFSYRHLDDRPVLVETFSAAVGWRNGELAIKGLNAAAPDGRVAGEIVAGLHRPSLSLDLTITPAHPVKEFDRLSVQSRLLPGRKNEQLAGNVTIAANSGAVKRLRLSGEVGMTRDSFNLRLLRLIIPGRHGTVTGEGALSLAKQEPFLTLQLKGDDLDLAPELHVPANLSGTLSFAGIPARYQGRFAFANRGKGWQTARISGSYQGNGEGMKLTSFTGALLDGTLSGDLAVDWREGVKLAGTIRGNRLNPAGIDPDWRGVINFGLSGNMAWSAKAPLRGEVSGRLLESTLHGQALSGEARADFIGSDLRIERLALKGKGFDLRASGQLKRRLDLTAQVSDFSRLIPGTAGELLAKGWVRWAEGHLAGAITGNGRNLAADGMRIKGAVFSARLEEGKGYPVQLAATFRKMAYGRFQADYAFVAADGTIAAHTLHATLRSAGTEARLALSGAYSRETWTGKILGFNGRDGIGPWNLKAPAAFAVGPKRIFLAPLVLTGLRPERLEIGAEIGRAPLGGYLRVEWNGVNLARANPWLNDMNLTGSGSGNVRLRILPGEMLALTGRSAASGTLTSGGHRLTVERSSLSIDGSGEGIRAGVEIAMKGGGVLHGSFISTLPARAAIPGEGNIEADYRSFDLALFRPWLPKDLDLGGVLTGRITGKVLAGGRFDLKGKTDLAGGMIHWQGGKKEINADLQAAGLSWAWRGGLQRGAAGVGTERLLLAGRATAAGSVTMEGERITVQRSSLKIDRTEQGSRADIELFLAGGGMLKGSLTTPSSAGAVFPIRGEVAAQWSGVEMTLLQPWLPSGIKVEGSLAGQTSGRLLPAGRLDLHGSAALSGGKVHWRNRDGEVNSGIRSASVTWAWQKESLAGSMALALTGKGEARADFRLPLAARIPASLDPRGAVQASINAKVQENGVLTALFPGMIRESHGDLDAALKVSGSWGEPRIEGTLQLAGAGAYLPTAGISVKDVRLTAHLEKDLIRIESFHAASGPGHIDVTALIRLKGWQVTGFRGNINGERFQTVFLPELQILSTPAISFEGSPEKLTVRGEVRIPELLINGPPSRAVVKPSGDVILEGRKKPVEKARPYPLDIQVKVVLGDKVLVKAEGIDAQIGGNVELTAGNLDRITSKGEIRVIKGRYRTYGVNLEIVRGRLYYAGGRIDQPTLDFLALRTVGDVRAGVTVGGPLRAPVTKLYSDPVMPDVDILAYIVLGHPLGSSSEQGGIMAQAAGLLLSASKSDSLKDQIKDRLGLSTLELQTASTENTGLMGYRVIPVTPTGVAPTAPAATQTFVTVGKYLTPQLYVSYGRSLFTGGNLLRLRYDVFKHWQVETQTGSESGADIYFKIEFD